MLAFLKRLWTKEPRPPLNLLAPDVLAEVVIHISPNGERRLYCSRLPPGTTKETYAAITMGVIQSGMEFGEQYGIKVHASQEG